MTMMTTQGAPIGPPPDLPSLLLKNRIVYLGTPITNEVRHAKSIIIISFHIHVPQRYEWKHIGMFA